MSLSFSLRTLFATLGVASAMVLAGCSSDEPEFLGSNISGTSLGSKLSMVDDNGQPRTLADYRDKVVVVFFGFTQCPDVCPTAMSQLAHAMELLGEDAKKVQILMVSVDPERDTPEILNAYVKAFNPSFVGLTGTPEQLAATAKSFRAYYSKVAGPTPDSYTMDHGSSFYILDQTGEARVLLRGDVPAEELVHDLRELI